MSIWLGDLRLNITKYINQNEKEKYFYISSG